MVKAEVNGRTLKGMMNIGLKPTVGGLERTLEVNLLDFDEDIYGTTLKVDLLFRLRAEQKFSGLEELKDQLIKDREATRKHFERLV